MPNFSRIAYPLSDLLKKYKKFDFNSDCIYAFETLKTALITSPVLSIYDPKKQTELHTDASSHDFGAVIMQLQEDNKLHPVAYYSKKTSEAESKYHSFELETMAIIHAIRRFETFLKGIPFRIITDCSALQMTLSKKQINPRIARWALELENYEYTVIHRSGANMGHVDALSRQIGLINGEDIDSRLQATQSRDEIIVKLRGKLEKVYVTHFS